MKIISYRGHMISATMEGRPEHRTPCFWVFREADNEHCMSGYGGYGESVEEALENLKARVDAELKEDDPWRLGLGDAWEGAGYVKPVAKIEADVGDVMRTVGVEVRLVGMKRFRLRTCLSVHLLRLAMAVLGVGDIRVSFDLGETVRI